MATAKADARTRELEARILRLENSVCLAKGKCKKCGSDIFILDADSYVRCDCGELFGDAGSLLAGTFDEINHLEWVDKSRYENLLLLGRLRRRFPVKKPAAK